MKKSPDRRLYPPGSLSYDSTLLSAFFSVTRVLKKRRQRRQRKWQKINRLRLAMNNISLFCVHFLSVVARLRPATSWFHGFHRGREHVTTSWCFFFCTYKYSPIEFNSWKTRQHLTKWTRWKKREKFEAARIHVLGDIFAAVTVVVA